MQLTLSIANKDLKQDKNSYLDEQATLSGDKSLFVMLYKNAIDNVTFLVLQDFYMRKG